MFTLSVCVYKVHHGGFVLFRGVCIRRNVSRAVHKEQAFVRGTGIVKLVRHSHRDKTVFLAVNKQYRIFCVLHRFERREVVDGIAEFFCKKFINAFQRGFRRETHGKFRTVSKFRADRGVGAIRHDAFHVFQCQFGHKTNGCAAQRNTVQNNAAVRETLVEFVNPQGGVEPFVKSESDVVSDARFAAAVVCQKNVYAAS